MGWVRRRASSLVGRCFITGTVAAFFLIESLYRHGVSLAGHCSLKLSSGLNNRRLESSARSDLALKDKRLPETGALGVQPRLQASLAVVCGVNISGPVSKSTKDTLRWVREKKKRDSRTPNSSTWNTSRTNVVQGAWKIFGDQAYLTEQ